MNVYTSSVILLLELVLTSTSSPSAPPFDMANLRESAVLSCQGKCSDSAQWVMRSSTGCTVARCNQTVCHHEEGFNISHDQYLRGDLSLTITAADYSLRAWYTCQCDGREIRRVYLRTKRVDYSRSIEHGDSFTVEFFISERVKITFNRTDDDGSQKSLTLYESNGNKVHYHPDCEKRALSKSCFILNDVRDSDSGVYTVWDADNLEIIATYTLSVTAKKTDNETLPPVKGEQAYSSWVPGLVFCGGLVLGILLYRFVFPWIQNGWNSVKKKRANSLECNHRTLEEKSDSPETVQLRSVLSL